MPIRVLLVALSLWSFTTSARAAVIHEFIGTPDQNNSRVEIFWDKPSSGRGPWPVLFLIHPHQEWPNKIGAQAFVKNGTIEYWVSRGFIAVAVSQPGYGGSVGPADFCGARSRRAVVDASGRA